MSQKPDPGIQHENNYTFLWIVSLFNVQIQRPRHRWCVGQWSLNIDRQASFGDSFGGCRAERCQSRAILIEVREIAQ